MKNTIILIATLCMATLACTAASLKTGATADDALQMVYVPSNGVPNYVEYDTNVWLSGTLTNIRWHAITYTYTAGEVLSRVLESYTVAGATSYALNVSGAVSPSSLDSATNKCVQKSGDAMTGTLSGPTAQFLTGTFGVAWFGNVTITNADLLNVTITNLSLIYTNMTINGVLDMSGYAITNLGRSTFSNAAARLQDVWNATNGITDTLLTNGSRSMGQMLSMGGFAITNLAEPPTANSAATKQYVDGATNGCFQTNSQVAVATAEGFLRSCDSAGTNLIFDSIYYNSWHIVPINNSDAELLENVWGWSVQATKMANAFACSLGNSLLSTSVVTRITIHTRSAASGWTPCTITNTFNHLFITTNTSTRTDILSLTVNNTNTFLTGGNYVLEQTNGLPSQNTTVAWKLQLQGVGGGTGMITSVMFKWLK